VDEAGDRGADHGESQNSQSYRTAQPPTNSAVAVLRAGFTEVFVTGRLIRSFMSITSDARWGPVTMRQAPYHGQRRQQWRTN